MSPGVRRQRVDLSAHPDLVVVYLGMRIRTPRGAERLARLAREIARSVAASPGKTVADGMFALPASYM